MAIYIIDQFSLNTDLPLDIRYVPNGGRFSPDVSNYKYPGIQVYDTSTQSIWYADNSLNWVEVGSGSDASLNEIFTILNSIDVSIGDIYSTLAIHDASIGDIYSILNIHDASIGDLEVRVSLLESSVGYLDSSIIQLFDGQLTQDSSIEELRSDILQIEASIGDINSYQGIQDASILANTNNIAQLDASIVRIDVSLNFIFDWQESQDASIVDLQNEILQIEASIGDINAYQGIQDSSILANTNAIGLLETSIGNIEASLGDYVRKDGDTMTGDLIISGAGLSVSGDTSLGNFHSTGDGILLGDLTVGGNFTVDGSVIYINTVTVNVSDNIIYLNQGLTGTPPATLQSGIVVGRGDEEPYVFLFDEDTQTFRIGVAEETSTGFLDASTQAVATREDAPTVDGIAVWNNTLNRFDTYPALTFDGGELKLDVSLNLSSLAGAQDLMLVVQPDGYVNVSTIPNYDASISDLYTYIDGSLAFRDASISVLFGEVSQLDASIVIINNTLISLDASIQDINTYQGIQDASILQNEADILQIEASIGIINDTLISLDGSIIRIDGSINQLFTLDASNIKGAINVGDGSAQVFVDVSNNLLTFREITGVGAAVVSENGNVIEISIDASFGGEVNTASNIGGGEGVFAQKVGQDLEFKSITTNDPAQVIITSDSDEIFIDVSIAAMTDVSMAGISDTNIDESTLATHQILEFNSDGSVWENTNGILWDTSLATTADDFNSIPAGTNLEGLTLKEILFKILYEYQIPLLDASGVPEGGIYEKGSADTLFSSVDIGYSTSNSNYPLALLNNLRITKTGEGLIFDASLGLVNSSTGSYEDTNGILNWGGVNRTITYQVEVDDNQSDQTQPAVIDQVNYTFYYPIRWGIVDKDASLAGILSNDILGLDSSILQGQTDLLAQFNNPSSLQIKHLFAYVDTIAAPDNFGPLSEIIDQNGYNVTGSFSTTTKDVSTDGGDVRYRIYLLNNWTDTSTFSYTFKF